MGSSFNTRIYQGTEKQVASQWNSDVELAGYEDGHGYSGSISELGKGFQKVNKIFNNVDEADDYISEHHSKWSSALAVQFTTKGGLAKSSVSKKSKLQDKVEIAERSLNDLIKKLISDLKNAKSKFIGCTDCGSKINRKYITHNGTCPLCSGSFLSQTAKNRITVATDKATKARVELRNYKPTVSKTAKTTKWLVGGWCSE